MFPQLDPCSVSDSRGLFLPMLRGQSRFSRNLVVETVVLNSSDWLII